MTFICLQVCSREYRLNAAYWALHTNQAISGLRSRRRIHIRNFWFYFCERGPVGWRKLNYENYYLSHLSKVLFVNFWIFMASTIFSNKNNTNHKQQFQNPKYRNIPNILKFNVLMNYKTTPELNSIICQFSKVITLTS